jgi:4-amino-4-deoxy-L-arabinose transferase-like glycosyltransferase
MIIWVIKHGARIMAVLIILLGFGLRAAYLGEQELRGDEAFGYFFSLQAIPQIVRQTLALEEPHPPTGYFLLHVWLQLAGHSEYALRYLSAWFGVLAIALMLALARQLRLPQAAALVAALLMAISPYAVYHSQDARMYTASLTLTLAATVAALHWQRAPSLWRAIVCVLCMAAALSVHYFTAFLFAALGLFVFADLAREGRWRRVVAWAAIYVSVGVIYIPWLWVAFGILTGYGGNGDSPGFWEMWRRALAVFVVGESARGPTLLWVGLAVLLLGMAIYGAVDGIAASRSQGGNIPRREVGQALLLLCMLWMLPLLLTWWSARARPIFNERYLIAAVPAFYLALATALVARREGKGKLLSGGLTGQVMGMTAFPATLDFRVFRVQRALVSRLAVLPVLLLGLLVLGAGLSLHRYYSDPAISKTLGWRELAAFYTRVSSGMPEPHVRITENIPDPASWYYYRGAVAHVVMPPAAHDEAGAARLAAAMVEDDVRRVIFPHQPAPHWDDNQIGLHALETRYTEVAQQRVGVWPVSVFAAPADLISKQIHFDNGLDLVGYSAEPALLQPGSLLSVFLAWEVAESAEVIHGNQDTIDGLTVFVQLLNEAGILVAQDDRPLPPISWWDEQSTRLTGYGILMPDAMTSGEYTLIAGLYRPAMTASETSWVRIETDDGRDHVVLTQIAVMGTSD